MLVAYASSEEEEEEVAREALEDKRKQQQQQQEKKKKKKKKRPRHLPLLEQPVSVESSDEDGLGDLDGALADVPVPRRDAPWDDADAAADVAQLSASHVAAPPLDTAAAGSAPAPPPRVAAAAEEEEEDARALDRRLARQLEAGAGVEVLDGGALHVRRSELTAAAHAASSRRRAEQERSQLQRTGGALESLDASRGPSAALKRKGQLAALTADAARKRQAL